MVSRHSLDLLPGPGEREALGDAAAWCHGSSSRPARCTRWRCSCRCCSLVWSCGRASAR